MLVGFQAGSDSGLPSPSSGPPYGYENAGEDATVRDHQANYDSQAVKAMSSTLARRGRE